MISIPPVYVTHLRFAAVGANKLASVDYHNHLPANRLHENARLQIPHR
jgi:hypothetical protein